MSDILTEPLLRPWSIEDIESVLTAFASDDMATQTQAPIVLAAQAEMWLAPRMLESPRAVSFAIDLAGVAVGEVALSRINPDHGTAWISYWVTPVARGAGLATRAVATLADWGFDRLELERIELAHRVNNPASAVVAARAGFLVEGTQRAKLRYAGERFDVVTNARLFSDPAPAFAPLEVIALELIG
ncbi:MAG: acetyltransferase [Thermoleophilia bacterium]|nr:acetyltransferase [Thermoleophilia bacterium]